MSGVRILPSLPSDPLAQSAEHLPFKQGVRSSNLRRVTTSSRTALVRDGFLFKKPSLTCSVAPPFQNANISLVCILVFLPILENSRTPCLFVHFTKGSVSVFDIQKDLRRPLHALCAAQPRPPPLLGLLPLCRNECLTATANTPDSTDLEKNV